VWAKRRIKFSAKRVRIKFKVPALQLLAQLAGTTNFIQQW
jgi:hypothetical protein